MEIYYLSFYYLIEEEPNLLSKVEKDGYLLDHCLDVIKQGPYKLKVDNMLYEINN